jgi:hypothetical protein
VARENARRQRREWRGGLLAHVAVVDLDAFRGVGEAIEVVKVVVPDVPLDPDGKLRRDEAHESALATAHGRGGDERRGHAPREDEDGRPRGGADRQPPHLRRAARPREDGARREPERERRGSLLAGGERFERSEEAREDGPIAAQRGGRSWEHGGLVGELLELAAELALAAVHLRDPRGEGAAAVGLSGLAATTRLQLSGEECDEGRDHEPRRHAMRHSSDGRPPSARASTGGAAAGRVFTNRAGRASSTPRHRSPRRRPRSEA